MRSHNAVVVWAIVRQPLKNLDSDLLLADLVRPPIESLVTDIGQEFDKPGRPAEIGTRNDAMHHVSSLIHCEKFMLRRGWHRSTSTGDCRRSQTAQKMIGNLFSSEDPPRSRAEWIDYNASNNS